MSKQGISGGLRINEDYLLSTVEHQGKDYEKLKHSFNTVGNMFPLLEGFDEMEKENETANAMKKDVEKVASDTAILNNTNTSDKLRTNNSDVSETENNKEFDDRLKKLIKNDAMASKKMNEKNQKVLSRINAKLGKLETENQELEQEIDRFHQDDNDYRHSLRVSHGDIEADITKLYSVEGQHEDSKLVLNARYYRYIVWTIAMVVIIMVTMRISTKSSGTITNVLAVLFLVFVLYTVLYYLNNLNNQKHYI